MYTGKLQNADKLYNSFQKDLWWDELCMEYPKK